MMRYWLNMIALILLMNFRVLLAACEPTIKQQVSYADNRFGQVYDLRGEATIHATRDDSMWVTTCDVDLPLPKAKKESLYCERPKSFPEDMTLSIDSDLNMTLGYGGNKPFKSKLIPRRLFVGAGLDTVYMESKERFAYGTDIYDAYIYLRMNVDDEALPNNVYKTYRIEFFDVMDEDCRNKEAPNVAKVIDIARKVPISSGLISLDDFNKQMTKKGGKRVTADPIFLDESQVGDGSEPRH